MIVSPSKPQSVVVAVGSNVRVLYEVLADSSMFRKSVEPFGLFKERGPDIMK